MVKYDGITFFSEWAYYTPTNAKALLVWCMRQEDPRRALERGCAWCHAARIERFYNPEMNDFQALYWDSLYDRLAGARTVLNSSRVLLVRLMSP